MSGVGITLWFLATPAEYRTIGHLFGVARCTVCVIVKEVSEAIVRVLQPKHIQFPTSEMLRETVQGFEQAWKVPQCVGAIDGSHIPILAPADNHTDYYNRKGWYSMLDQGTVDYKYCFTDINVGWPGNVHDARVLVNSMLYKKGVNGTLMSESSRAIGSGQVPLYSIGDSAYPLQCWLMKPFPYNSQLSEPPKYYNYRMCHVRIVVENAFGRLKARGRRLMKKNEISASNIPSVIAACYVLHNIREIHGDSISES